MGSDVIGHEWLSCRMGAAEPFKQLIGVSPTGVDQSNLERKSVATRGDQTLESHVSLRVIAERPLRQRRINFAPDTWRLQLCLAQRDVGVSTQQSEQRERRMDVLGAG